MKTTIILLFMATTAMSVCSCSSPAIPTSHTTPTTAPVGPTTQSQPTKQSVPPSPEDVAAVNAMIDALNKDVAANPDSFANYFVAKDVPVIKGLISSIKMQASEGAILKNVAKAKGFLLPPAISAYIPRLSDIAVHLRIEKASVVRENGQMAIVESHGEKRIVVKENGGYKFALDKMEVQYIEISSESFRGMASLYQSFAEGIDDGTLTKENLTAKWAQWGKKYIEPSVTKMQRLKAENVAGATPASDEEVAAIKAMLTAVKKDVVADLENYAKYFDDRYAPIIRKEMASTKALRAKSNVLVKAAKAKGVGLPHIVTTVTDHIGDPAGVTKHLSPDSVIILKKGDILVLVLANFDNEEVVKTPNGYRFRPGETELKSSMNSEKFVTAMGHMVDALTAGINDGSIASGNIDDKSFEFYDRYIKPAPTEVKSETPSNPNSNPTSAPPKPVTQSK